MAFWTCVLYACHSAEFEMGPIPSRIRQPCVLVISPHAGPSGHSTTERLRFEE